MKLLSFPSKEERAALRNSPLDGLFIAVYLPNVSPYFMRWFCKYVAASAATAVLLKTGRSAFRQMRLEDKPSDRLSTGYTWDHASTVSQPDP